MKKTQKTTKATVRKLNPNKAPLFRTWADAKNALLIVSLLANLFVLCLWLSLHATTKYDQALFDFFVSR